MRALVKHVAHRAVTGASRPTPTLGMWSRAGRPAPLDQHRIGQQLAQRLHWFVVCLECSCREKLFFCLKICFSEFWSIVRIRVFAFLLRSEKSFKAKSCILRVFGLCRKRLYPLRVSVLDDQRHTIFRPRCIFLIDYGVICGNRVCERLWFR